MEEDTMSKRDNPDRSGASENNRVGTSVLIAAVSLLGTSLGSEASQLTVKTPNVPQVRITPKTPLATGTHISKSTLNGTHIIKGGTTNFKQ
jgi:hypothetical protein